MAAVSRAGRRAAVLAGVVAGHAALLLALFWQFGSPPRYTEPPVMSVVLARPFPERPPRREPTPPRRGAAIKAAPALREVAARPALSPPPEIAPSAVPGRSPSDVQTTLRALVGCRQAALSRAAREACETRLGERQMADLGRDAARLNLDIHGAFGKDPQAILERRPTNGCRARAGGDVAPMGEIGVAAGVACAKPF